MSLFSVEYWFPNQQKIEGQKQIKETCESVEKVSEIVRGVFFGLTALGGVSMTFTPVIGMMTALSCGCLTLLSHDVRVISHFIKNDLDSSYRVYSIIKENLLQNDIQKLDAETLLKLSEEINYYLDRASGLLSPLGETLVNILKETTLAILKTRAGYVDKNLVSSLISWYSKQNIGIPNFDYIREGLIHASHAIKDLSLLSIAFWGSIALVGCASLALKSVVPGLVLYLAALSWIKRNYEIDRVVFTALGLVGASFIYIGGGALASTGVLIAGAIGIILSYDLRQLANNVAAVSQNEKLKNATAIFSGWGMVGFARTLYHYYPQVTSLNFSNLFSQEKVLSNDEVERKIQEAFDHVENSFRQNLTNNMTPVGAFLVTRIFSNVKNQ